MLTHLLDTDTIIFAMKNKTPQLRHKFNALQTSMCMSTISLMELSYGAYKSANTAENLNVIKGLIARIEVLHYDEEAALHTGQIRAELAKQGNPIGPYDQMIAGHARSRGLVIVTNNEKEFSRVEGIRFENWL